MMSSSSDTAYNQERRGEWEHLTLNDNHMGSTIGVEGIGSGGVGYGSMARGGGSGGRRSGSLSSAEGDYSGHHFGYSSRGNG
jgi:hypothetical protein